jgi:nucleoside-diphosphate-sugar epimerase
VISRVLVTGASGFVGRALICARSPSRQFIAASRRPPNDPGVEWRRGPALSATADWKPLLEGIDSVVHLAGRVHLPSHANPSAYQVENCEGTIKIARDAAAMGVGRFVFMSTAKVVGDESGKFALDESVPCRPAGAYAISKHAAEQGLQALGKGMQVLVLRPPLVYGPGVKANFLSLLSAVNRGLPLPLASIHNKRSFVGIDNLVSAILASLDSHATAGRTFHVTDGPARSTPQLVKAIASALGIQPRLFGLSPTLLETCAMAIGRGETVKRLTRSLELDDSAIRTELGWREVKTFEEGIAQTARWYVGRSGAGSA